jgi:anti-anti-sigma factor
MSGSVSIELTGDRAVIALAGELDCANADDLGNALRAARSDPGVRVAVDLTDTSFVDLAILKLLAIAWRDGTNLSVRGATGEARRALELSGLLCKVLDDA